MIVCNCLSSHLSVAFLHWSLVELSHFEALSAFGGRASNNEQRSHFRILSYPQRAATVAGKIH